MASPGTLVDQPPIIQTQAVQLEMGTTEVDPTPEWINERYVEKILKNYYRDATVKVKAIDVSYAMGKGDNWASILYRVRAPFSSKTQGEKVGCYVIKAMFDPNSMAAERLGEYDVHNKEMDIYENIIPSLIQLQKSVDDHDRLCPTVIYIDREHDVMVFEDVCAIGYKMLSRIKGLDLAHTKMVLSKLAKMHALATVLHENKKCLGKYVTGMFNRSTDVFHSFFKTSMQALIDEVTTWPGYEYYAEKLNGLKSTFIENAIKCFDCDEADDLGTLIHGDLWVTNVMFKYNEKGQPIDVLMLDFQLSAYASPIIDIIYFLYTSTYDEIRQTKQDEMFQFYYYELTNMLKRLKYSGSIPTLHQFQMKVLKKSFYVFISAMVIFPVMINEDTRDADFEALMGVNERGINFKKVVWSNPKLRIILQQLLPVLDRKGIFDGV